MDSAKEKAYKLKFKYSFLLLRPRQWIKNLFVLAPLLFSGSLVIPLDIMAALCALSCFCITASAIYIINDMFDAEKDAAHPLKRYRPLPAGLLSINDAKTSLTILLPASLLSALILNRTFGCIILCYMLNNLLYNLFLKKLIILDVISVAAGFLLRVAGGAVVISVKMSPYLILCTFLLALLLGLYKRKNELFLLGGNAEVHRPSLSGYTSLILNRMLTVVSVTIIISYSMYALFSSRGGYSFFAAVFVVYGILRYRYLMNKSKKYESPEETLLNDIPLLANIFLWTLYNILLIYFF